MLAYIGVDLNCESNRENMPKDDCAEADALVCEPVVIKSLYNDSRSLLSLYIIDYDI